MDQIERFKQVLIKKGYSVTRPRLQTFTSLMSTGSPLTTTELTEKLSTIDKVSVYRTIKLFEEIGIIHRVWTGFKSKIELSDEFSPHHHHFSCVCCSKTINIKSDEIENVLNKIEDENGFALTHHSVELRGYCESCRK